MSLLGKKDRHDTYAITIEHISIIITNYHKEKHTVTNYYHIQVYMQIIKPNI